MDETGKERKQYAKAEIRCGEKEEYQMQLLVRHKLYDKLVLPLNYSHILQAIIYSSLAGSREAGNFWHEEGFSFCGRVYKIFTFSLLKGKYEIEGKKIIFRDKVSFEVRSPDIFFIQCIAENFLRNGIWYGRTHISDVEVLLSDDTVESSSLQIKMITPVCVYSTDPETKKMYFYHPFEEEFARQIQDNFMRKYIACYGAVPDDGVLLRAVKVSEKDKFVTRYKGLYLSGWYGTYELYGQRKYLDFLYQTGLGARNSQGFGMFDKN